MPTISVLPATDTDRSWAAALLSGQEPWVTLGVSYQTCLANCTDPDLDLYIAHREGVRCGMMLIHPKGFAGSPYIKSIATDPDLRNTGAGFTMMHFIEEKYGSYTGHIALCVSSFNTRAKHFYQRSGYRQVGVLQDYIISGASEIIMVKKIG